MNESYHISRFRSLHEFTKNLPFLWHLLNCKLPKTGRKLKQSLEVHMLTRELCVFTKKDHSVFRGTCRQVVYEMSFVCIQRSFLVKKMISPVIIIWHRAFIQTVKCSLLDKKIVYQSFYGPPLTFTYFFYLKEKFCVCTRWEVACEIFIVGIPKKLYLHIYLTHVYSNSKMLFL